MRITHTVAAMSLLLISSPSLGQEGSGAVPAEPPQSAFDSAPWLADYAGLKDAMARGYANLDWIVAHSGPDLAALDRETIAMLQSATSEREAIAAITHFAQAFGDNHLRGSPGRAPVAALVNAGLFSNSASTGEAQSVEEQRSQSCEALGYRDGGRWGAFDPALLPGWQRLESPWFTAGTFGEPGNRTALIRLHSFSETDYLAACEATWQSERSERETQLATRAALQDELSRIANELAANGAHVLALDVTGNGGGSEWSEEAAALFSAEDLTRPQPRLVQEPGCDRSGVWRGEKVCSNLAPAGEVDRMEGAGSWTGPVAVLIGGKTASAAEDFAYWLAGSGVATLVGERTLGLGCGYMDGGRAYQFTAIEGYVMMPNCSRYTFEGVNQIEGIEPDLPIAWEEADLSTLAQLMSPLSD